MQKKLLTAIIKSKIQKTKTTETLIDEFIELQGGIVKERLSDFLSELLVYINKSLEIYDKDVVLSLVESKLKSLKVDFDTKEIESIYESIAISSAVGNTALVFNKIDLDTISMMKQSFFWTGKEYNEKTSDKLKNVIESAFNGEVPRADLGAKLKEEFNGIIDADERYFKGVSDHIISQSQNISRVNQALKYDVKHFKVRARIDNKTSVVCRSMHGRIIDASHLEAQIIAILNAKDIGQKKGAAIWSSKPVFGKLAKNFGLPPYHFLCRTGVEPVWVDEDERYDEATKKKYTVKSTTVNKKYKLIHIDKTGIEVKVKPNIYDKIGVNKHELTEKQLVGALNDIKYKAPHKDVLGRTIALSNSGYVLFYDADELVSCYPPDIGGIKYFNKWAKENEIVDVDTNEVKEKVKKWYEILI